MAIKDTGRCESCARWKKSDITFIGLCPLKNGTKYSNDQCNDYLFINKKK